MKIFLIDSWKAKYAPKSEFSCPWMSGSVTESKFFEPVMHHWHDLGHEVQTWNSWGPPLVDWADGGLCYFAQTNNNLKRASTETEKSPNTRIIVEAVDADIYGGHWKAVDWTWVDGLVCMSKHMLRWMETTGPGLPDSLPRYHVPGGVDLDTWPMRREPVHGYNVAWIGNHWIAKNTFGALQVFNELIRRDPSHPWHLFVRGQKWHPNWWQAHVEGYMATNPELAERVTWIDGWVPDLNEWLEDKHYLLQTSFKEALGYVVCQAAAKGIRPVIQNTNGALDIWPREWVFDTHSQAIDMFLDAEYQPWKDRDFVNRYYPLYRRLAALDEICFGGG